MIVKADMFVKKNMIWLVLATLGFGLLIGMVIPVSFMKALKWFILPSAFIMLWASMITMKTEHFVKSFKQPKQLVVGNIMSLIIAPLLMLPLALTFAKEPHIYAGLVLAGIAPPGGFVTYWAMLLNANMGLAVSLTLTTFLVSLLLIPWGMKWLVGGKVKVNVLGLFYKILILVVGPFVLAMITRRLIIGKEGNEKRMLRFKPWFSFISSLMALYLVFAGISLKAEFLIQHWQLVAMPVVGAFLYYLIAYPLSYFVLHKLLKFSLFDSIPLVYGTATKNLSIAMGLAAAAFGPLTLLGVVTCMIFQMPMASLWHKYFAKFEIVEGETIVKIKEEVKVDGKTKEVEELEVFEDDTLKEVIEKDIENPIKK